MKIDLKFFFLLTSVIVALSIADTTKVRMKIAVLNLKNANGVSTADAELISDRLRNEFFNTGTVDVMEREQMQSVLKEQGFQQSGTTCTDEGCIVEMGKLLGVRRIIIGSVGKLGSMFMINIRGINVESGKIEKVVSEDVKGEIDKLVEILPRIAGVFTGTVIVNIQSSPEPPRTQTQAKEVTPAKQQPTASSNTYPCDKDTLFLEEVTFTPSQVGIPLTGFDFVKLNETIAESIGDAVDKEIAIVPKADVPKLACQAHIFRIFLKTCIVKTNRDNENEGKVNLIVSLYESSKASQPQASVAFEESGDTELRATDALMKAFEEVCDEIEDDLENEVDRYIK